MIPTKEHIERAVRVMETAEAGCADSLRAVLIDHYAALEADGWQMIKLEPIETAPTDGSYILLFGPSGYVNTPLRCEVGHYDYKYRPLNPWQTHSDDAFTDGGELPTHWMQLPKPTTDRK